METEMKLEHDISLRWLLLFALPTILSSVFANLYTTVNGIFAYGQMTSFVQLSINYLNPPRSPLAEHYAESLHENRAGVPAAEPCR